MEGRVRYELRHVLGRGGFGTVYLANMVGTGGFSQSVAVKMLHGRRNPEIGARLRDEARMLALVKHRSIVVVHALDVIEGDWAVVMEYVEGVDLKGLVGLAIPPAVVAEIGEEVASALDAAWSRDGPDGQPLQLLHRDVKPGNIRVTPHGDVKLMDFGVARGAFEGREAETGTGVYGSPKYMAPERLYVVGGQYLHEGDVYGVGCVLFELLVGGDFGPASASASEYAAILERGEARLRDWCDDEGLVEAVLGCLAADPDERPSAAELARQLRAVHRRLDGDGLREWARTTVADVLKDQPLEPVPDEDATEVTGSLSGGELTPLVVGPPSTEPVPARRGPLPWVLAGVVLAALVGGAGLSLTRTDEPTREDVPEVAEPEPELPAAPVEVVEAEPVIEETPSPVEELPVPAEPEPVEVAPIVEEPTPPLEPEPVPVEPEPAPEEAWSTPTTVRFEGDAVAVQLKRGDLAYGAGEVEPGDYTVWATWEGTEPAPAGSVTVPEATETTIVCSAGFYQCRAR